MALFGQGDFTINQNTTPEMLRQKRARLAAMMPQYGKAEYIGQGLGQLFQGIGSGRSERRMDEYEGQRSKEATGQYNSAMNGFGSGGPLSVLGMAPSGTWTPDAAAPSPTDVPGATAGLRFGMNTPDAPAEGAGGLGFTPPPMTPQQMIVAGSEARGLNPIDVATAISYETGGTFDPMQTGPTTQWGQHQGFIQFGKPQAEQYGADFSNPQTAMNSQLDPKTGAVWNYLDGTGVKPGMGLDNIYSAINAGAPGRFNASDANNGGAPGTVADKVAGMGDHRTKATEFMGGTWTPAAGVDTPGLTVSTQGQAPQGGDLQMLMQAASNPWLTPEQRGMVNGMIQQQQGRDQAIWQQQLAQSDPMYQAQLAELTAPKPVDPFTLGEGQVRYDGSGAEIARGGVNAPQTPAAVQEYNFYATQEQAAGRQPLSFNDWDLQARKAGATTITNDMSGGGKFEEAFAKGDAATIETVYNSGLAAQRNLGRIDQLEGLLASSATGMEGAAKLAAGEWGINTEGLDALQSAQAMINSLVPEQRQPGSGPMSDADLALFKQSLPRIINQQGGNKIIVDTMRAIAQYDAEGARIVQGLRSGAMNRSQAFDALQNRANPLASVAGGGAAGNDDTEYLKTLGLE